jgi:NAD(P)-dependent dehydrogenase (short-subunit alcohol dehydrogenase family)
MLNATNANERADKIALTPLRRLGEPIEVAYGVLFLASDGYCHVKEPVREIKR